MQTQTCYFVFDLDGEFSKLVVEVPGGKHNQESGKGPALKFRLAPHSGDDGQGECKSFSRPCPIFGHYILPLPYVIKSFVLYWEQLHDSLFA